MDKKEELRAANIGRLPWIPASHYLFPNPIFMVKNLELAASSCMGLLCHTGSVAGRSPGFGGTLFGFPTGLAWFNRRGGLSTEGPLLKRFLRFLIGVVGILVFYLRWMSFLD
jgi:hypothetical protein